MLAKICDKIGELSNISISADSMLKTLSENPKLLQTVNTWVYFAFILILIYIGYKFTRTILNWKKKSEWKKIVEENMTLIRRVEVYLGRLEAYLDILMK